MDVLEGKMIFFEKGTSLCNKNSSNMDIVKLFAIAIGFAPDDDETQQDPFDSENDETQQDPFDLLDGMQKLLTCTHKCQKRLNKVGFELSPIDIKRGEHMFIRTIDGTDCYLNRTNLGWKTLNSNGEQLHYAYTNGLLIVAYQPSLVRNLPAENCTFARFRGSDREYFGTDHYAFVVSYDPHILSVIATLLEEERELFPERGTITLFPYGGNQRIRFDVCEGEAQSGTTMSVYIVDMEYGIHNPTKKLDPRVVARRKEYSNSIHPTLVANGIIQGGPLYNFGYGQYQVYITHTPIRSIREHYAIDKHTMCNMTTEDIVALAITFLNTSVLPMLTFVHSIHQLGFIINGISFDIIGHRNDGKLMMSEMFHSITHSDAVATGIMYDFPVMTDFKGLIQEARRSVCRICRELNNSSPMFKPFKSLKDELKDIEDSIWGEWLWSYEQVYDHVAKAIKQHLVILTIRITQLDGSSIEPLIPSDSRFNTTWKVGAPVSMVRQMITEMTGVESKYIVLFQPDSNVEAPLSDSDSIPAHSDVMYMINCP